MLLTSKQSDMVSVYIMQDGHVNLHKAKQAQL